MLGVLSPDEAISQLFPFPFWNEFVKFLICLGKFLIRRAVHKRNPLNKDESQTWLKMNNKIRLENYHCTDSYLIAL